MAENVFEDKALQKYLNEIAGIQTLTREEEHDLAVRTKQGDEAAVEKLIRSNLKFVVKIAAHYQNRGLTLSELISEGNMGLIKAIEKFDPDKGIKLISYAVWWIKQRILFALAEKTSLIRMPLGKTNTANKIKAAKERIFNRTGNRATIDDIAGETKLVNREIDNIESTRLDTLSLDDISYTSKSDVVRFHEFIEDPDAHDPKRLYFRDKLKTKIDESITQLDDRDAYIIRSYFGLSGEEGCNFAEIAEKLGLSRERVRQIQKQALRQIMSETYDEYKQDIDQLINTNL
ncbi:MAG: RNA polymerase sigma factor RpoD/SigA [Candidatus Cloacimonetes bacterium]|nr:RNA polymerase sigma factor RpoD/SigA [Candidatus Cloacimonadota bacterium]